MTNMPSTSADSRTISVICLAPTATDALLTTIKQLFSMKPANWKITVELILERPTASLDQLIASLGLAIKVVPVKTRRKMNRAANACAKGQSETAATLWLDARLTLVSDALSRLETFHRQYPNAVLVGPFSVAGQTSLPSGTQGTNLGTGSRSVAVQNLPSDVDEFARNLVFVPASVVRKVGQPIGWLNQRTKYRWFVRKARKAGFRCMELPGKFGDQS